MEEKPLDPDRRGCSVLSDRQLLDLAELGCRVQTIYGYPQDIEWALMDGEFVLFQTRPMTSFSFDPEIGQWTSGNYREVLPGFASPLALSLSLEHDYGRAFTEFFRKIGLGNPPPGTIWWLTISMPALWRRTAVTDGRRCLPIALADGRIETSTSIPSRCNSLQIT